MLRWAVVGLSVLTVVGLAAVAVGTSWRLGPTAEPVEEPTVVSATAGRDEAAPAGPGASWPDAESTGPTSGDLTPLGDLDITEDGAVVEGAEIGCLDVLADDVTVRDSVIRCGRGTWAVLADGTGLVLEDVEVDGLGSAGNCIASGRYTLLRVELHSCVDGARANGDVVIRDSFIHSLVREPDSHNDAIQTTRGSDIEIVGNTLLAYTDGDPMNAAYLAGSAQGPVDRVVVTDNYLNGGNYTLQIDPGITDGVYERNVFGRDHRYGAVAGVPDQITWRDNTYADTGETVE